MMLLLVYSVRNFEGEKESICRLKKSQNNIHSHTHKRKRTMKSATHIGKWSIRRKKSSHSTPPLSGAKKKDDSDEGQVIVNEFSQHRGARLDDKIEIIDDIQHTPRTPDTPRTANGTSNRAAISSTILWSVNFNLAPFVTLISNPYAIFYIRFFIAYGKVFSVFVVVNFI